MRVVSVLPVATLAAQGQPAAPVPRARGAPDFGIVRLRGRRAIHQLGRRDDDGDGAPVLRGAGGEVAVRNQPLAAVGGRANAVGGDSQLHEAAPHALRAVLGYLDIVARDVRIVGVSFDDDGEIRMPCEPSRLRLQRHATARAQLCAGIAEEYAVADLALEFDHLASHRTELHAVVSDRRQRMQARHARDTQPSEQPAQPFPPDHMSAPPLANALSRARLRPHWG
jgi:hypothetical protein